MSGSGGIAPQFLILPLDTGEQLDTLHGRTTPGERAPRMGEYRAEWTTDLL